MIVRLLGSPAIDRIAAALPCASVVPAGTWAVAPAVVVVGDDAAGSSCEIHRDARNELVARVAYEDRDDSAG